MKIQKKSETTPSQLQELQLQKAQNREIASSVIQSSLNKKENVGDYNVSLTNDGQNLRNSYAKAFEIAKNTSPIREDRVQELKAKIQRGEYKVDSENIADGMIREAVKDYLSLETR